MFFDLCSWVSNVVCTLGSRASYIWGCWKQDHHAIRQHVLLGRLVQWWSITGLLPKYPGELIWPYELLKWKKKKATYNFTCEC